MKDRKRSKKRKRSYAWYVHPVGSWTNKIIGEMLPGETTSEIACNDGHSREMWQCTFTQVQAIVRSRKNDKLTFSIWSRVIPSGKARNVSVIFAEKRQAAAV